MNMRRYLVIGAHPDDSDLRFGGTAVKLAKAGHQVKFVSLTNGSCGHYNMDSRALAERRYKEAQDSKEFNMVCEYEVWDIDDCQITPSLENRERLIRTIRRFAPDVVISHRLCDYHADHRNTAQLVLDSAYLVKVPLYVPDTPIPEIEPVFGYFFDEFQDPRPCRKDAVVPIDDVMEQKCKGMDCHVSQFYEWLPKDRLYAAPPYDTTPWEARYKHLLQYWSQKYVDCANDARAALTKYYGDAGAKVKYAEAFEFSPYGRRVSPEEFQQLFMP